MKREGGAPGFVLPGVDPVTSRHQALSKESPGEPEEP